MTKPHTEYTPEVQKLFLSMMLSNPELYTRVSSILNPKNFAVPLSNVMEFIQDHAEKYKSMPTPLKIKTCVNFEIDLIPDLNEGDTLWFLDEFENFTRRKELERAIVKSFDMLENGEFDPVEKLIKDAVQVSLQRDLGLDYFADPRGRLMSLKNGNGQVSSGWKALDKKLYGGFNRGELEIFCGASGCVTGDTIVEIVDESIGYVEYARIDSLLGVNFHSQNIYVASPDGYVKVLDCVEKIKAEMYRMTFESGRIIDSSFDHLFQKRDLSWHYSKDLKVGDILLADNGSAKIVKIEKSNTPTKVYDLSVDHDNHRYYTNGICSHNTGKSIFLQNLAVNYSLAGYSGVYITLELSEELCAMRIDSMMTDTKTTQVFQQLDDVELKVKSLGKKAGQLLIKYFPAQSTINHIKSYCKELQIQTGIKLDFICIDYLDLMMPASVKVNPSDAFVKDKYVSEEIRNFAKELNIIGFTCSQLNRDAVGEEEFDHSHIAGGISKINTADNVFGIHTSLAMKEKGRYRLQLLKTRSSAGVGHYVELGFNVDTLRVYDLNLEDEDDGFSNAPTVNTDSTPKVNANVSQGTKVRNLLKQLKSQG